MRIESFEEAVLFANMILDYTKRVEGERDLLREKLTSLNGKDKEQVQPTKKDAK